MAGASELCNNSAAIYLHSDLQRVLVFRKRLWEIAQSAYVFEHRPFSFFYLFLEGDCCIILFTDGTHTKITIHDISHNREKNKTKPSYIPKSTMTNMPINKDAAGNCNYCRADRCKQ
jgi:serine/threonine protein phosphatase PrpC